MLESWNTTTLGSFGSIMKWLAPFPQVVEGALSTNGVGVSYAKWALNQEAMEGADLVINQMIGGHTDCSITTKMVCAILNTW
jgi:alpha-galactosidase/6-phospho-beta-glucosidase family protein